MRILFVHNALTGFVRVDRDILASVHEVDELDLSVPARVAGLPPRLLRADLIYAWFASLHSLAPVLGAAALRKPSLVVVGGYDTANMPEIGYGHMAHPWKRHVVRAICNTATALIANSHAAAVEVRHNTGTRTPIHTLYHGFPAARLPLPDEREPLVLSIGNVTAENLQRKGHEVFVRAAGLVPEARFVLVGECEVEAAERLRRLAGPNVELAGYLTQSALEQLCARASVYVQASAHEGFGCAVAEAMTYGCIPVVSHAGALPEVVGDRGIFADANDPSSVAAGVRTALAATPEDRRAVARRVAGLFSLESRRDQLLDLVELSAR